ncbi:FecR family protein [Pedobacter sp. KBW06]|uniref:FecR family protein n=1 Tax=Pedobacter sp. KBW06 TaxID=2153359 RepID=UPI0013154B98|nr:FecR domain-containing protein [Pedobacter sp. KBW06]
MNAEEKAKMQDLMIRSITADPLTVQEQKELSDWLNLEPGNRQEYDDLLTFRSLIKQEQVNAPDVDQAWGKVSQRIGAPLRSPLKISLFSGWLKYAAILVLLSTVGLLVSRNFYSGPGSKPEQTLAAVKPGSHHAELILPNGEHVKLQDQAPLNISGDQNALVARNKGNILVYATGVGQEGYHKLIVPEGAQYEIILPDKSHAWVNSGSELTYRIDFNNSAIREVKLVGEAYFKVAKDKKHPFIVKTDHMDVEAVGTAFNVIAYKGADYTETALVEGIVNVTDKQGNKQRMLAGSKIRISNKKINTLPGLEKTSLAYDDYAWKDGVFVFDNMPLEQICEQISRWYRVKIVFSNDGARKLHFTGSMQKDKPLSTVLRFISTSTNVKFEFKNSTLYITKP